MFRERATTDTVSGDSAFQRLNHRDLYAPLLLRADVTLLTEPHSDGARNHAGRWVFEIF